MSAPRTAAASSRPGRLLTLAVVACLSWAVLGCGDRADAGDARLAATIAREAIDDLQIRAHLQTGEPWILRHDWQPVADNVLGRLPELDHERGLPAVNYGKSQSRASTRLEVLPSSDGRSWPATLLVRVQGPGSPVWAFEFLLTRPELAPPGARPAERSTGPAGASQGSLEGPPLVDQIVRDLRFAYEWVEPVDARAWFRDHRILLYRVPGPGAFVRLPASLEGPASRSDAPGFVAVLEVTYRLEPGAGGPRIVRRERSGFLRKSPGSPFGRPGFSGVGGSLLRSSAPEPPGFSPDARVPGEHPGETGPTPVRTFELVPLSLVADPGSGRISITGTGGDGAPPRRVALALLRYASGDSSDDSLDLATKVWVEESLYGLGFPELLPARTARRLGD